MFTESENERRSCKNLYRKNKKTLLIVAIVSVVVPLFLNTVFYRVFNIKLPVGKLF